MQIFTLVLAAAVLLVVESGLDHKAFSHMRSELEELLQTSRPELIPKFVRIGFHTCLNSGGCTGCLDTDDRHNRGMVNAYETILDMHRSYADVINVADYVALCTTVAFEAAIKNIGCGRSCEITLPFKTGRTTCSDLRNPRTQLPDGDNTKSVEFLSDRLDLSLEDAVVLLGVGHSLGGCRRENSGFSGRWDSTPLTADNGWFRNLANERWLVRKIGSTSQWESENGHMMLHADVSAAWDVGPLSNRNKMPHCHPIDHCPHVKSWKLVQYYAEHEEEFIKRAIDVFLAMIEKGSMFLTSVPGGYQQGHGGAQIGAFHQKYDVTGAIQNALGNVHGYVSNLWSHMFNH